MKPSGTARKLRHLAEAALFAFAWAVFRALPLDAASWLGGKLGRLIGPRLPLHRIARINLSLAFPEKTLAEVQAIADAMWEHLGRVMAEFAHLPGMGLFSRISFSGLEHLPLPGKPVIFVSGHLGNWELTYPVAHGHGVPMTLVYRHSNNPYIDRMIGLLRRSHASSMFPKGPRGVAKMGGALKRGESLAMLIDQKMNEGISVPFFGHEAMTAPAFAQLSLRYHLPVIPARIVRTKGAHFKAVVYPPLVIAPTGDEEADVRTMTLAMHALLEGWIREHPEQWFWVHRRWGKEHYGLALSEPS